MARLLPFVPVFLLSVYPLAAVVGANLGVVPMSADVLLRSIAVSLAAAAVLLFLAWGVRRDLIASATWLTLVLILLTFYSAIILGLEEIGRPVFAGDPVFALSYVAVAVVLATIASRHVRAPGRLTVVAGALLLVTLAPGLAAAARERSAAWREPADALIDRALSRMPATPPPPQRDIYYIVLDGFGSAATLREYYGADISGLVTELSGRGFEVPALARTNYTQTFLSLASTLNLTYLDDLAGAVGVEARDRRPLAHLIQQNALMRMASRAGYRVVAIGSDYTATERMAVADVCVCPRYGLDEIELAALALTPLAALPVERWRTDPFDGHRRKVMESFDAIRHVSADPAPTFVFAHILVPHPPFVFAADASARRPTGRDGFAFNDGDHYRGTREEYVTGYRDQVRYVATQVAALVAALQQGKGAAPAIVIHGDHGPGSKLRWERPDATDMRERVEIFAAYSMPGGPPVSPAITPVNGARALARYFGADLERLPDDSFYSRWSRPYEFIRVPPGR